MLNDLKAEQWCFGRIGHSVTCWKGGHMEERADKIFKAIKMHTVETHNFHIRRYGRCPYCMQGSKPVPKAEIIHGV
jgi:hypothetical protein